MSLLHNEEVYCYYREQVVRVNIDLEDQVQSVDSADIYQDLKTIQAVPPWLLKEFNTEVFILANKLMTEDSFVQNTSDPFGALLHFSQLWPLSY